MARLRALASSPAAAGWVVSRIVVVAALAFTRFLVDHAGAVAATGQPPVGLLGWDAAWYVRIVESGYQDLPREALRFFPLFPLVATPLKVFVGARLAVLLVANGAALIAAVALHQLVREETGDRRLADRSAWLLALLPASFVLAMGYSESVLLLTTIVGFRMLRSGRFGWAALAGFLAGFSRPVGMLFAIPATVEAVRGWRNADRDRTARLLAAVAPIAGAATYLAWVGVRFGDALRPLTEQQNDYRRGDFVNPVSRLMRAGGELWRGEDLGAGLHLVAALVFLGLLVVVARHFPAAYTLYAAALLAVATSSTNLDSLERYGLSAFPLVIGLAHLARSPALERAVFAIAGAGLFVYASLAFLGVYVP
ncbi:MAG: mannosyltransferase family protein [Acidimicrobiales bacterium]